MDSGVTVQILALVFLLASSSFFSASETALTSISKIRVRHLVDQNVKGAKTVEYLLNNSSKLLSGILIGNNVVNIGASSLATKIAMDAFGDAGVGISTGVMTILVLTFAEITPKSFATNNAESVALKVAKPVSTIIRILSPIISIFDWVTSFIIKYILRSENSQGPLITEEELKTMVDVSHEEGILKLSEKEIIENVFDFDNLKANEIMTNRQDILALDYDSTYEDIKNTFVSGQYSKIPIYVDDIDNIIGVIYVKDLIYYDKEDEFKIDDYVREVFYTYENSNITNLFTSMQKRKISIAVVLDEYGGTEGIITTEDLVESIVGDIVDEFDDHSSPLEQISDKKYLVDGELKLDRLNKYVGINLKSDDFESIGGYITEKLGRLPEIDDFIIENNIRFSVVEKERNKIEKVKIEIK